MIPRLVQLLEDESHILVISMGLRRPPVGRPDFDVSIGPHDDGLFADIGLLAQGRGDKDAPHLIGRYLKGARKKLPVESARCRACGGHLGGTARDLFPQGARKDGKAGVMAARDDQAISQLLAHPRRDGEPPLGIERMRVLPQKHLIPAFAFLGGPGGT